MWGYLFFPWQKHIKLLVPNSLDNKKKKKKPKMLSCSQFYWFCFSSNSQLNATKEEIHKVLPQHFLGKCTFSFLLNAELGNAFLAEFNSFFCIFCLLRSSFSCLSFSILNSLWRSTLIISKSMLKTEMNFCFPNYYPTCLWINRSGRLKGNQSYSRTHILQSRLSGRSKSSWKCWISQQVKKL